MTHVIHIIISSMQYATYSLYGTNVRWGTYPDFSSCVLSGTKVANELIITLTPEEINKDQLYVQFACIKNPEPNI